MKKEIYRDYITDVFRFYAVNEGKISDDMTEAEKEDIRAVNQTLSWFDFNHKQHIKKAIEEIYFVFPAKPLKRGEVTDRVIKHSMQISTDERTVYRWLKEARLVCARFRGLRIY